MPKSRQRKNRRLLIPGSISKLALLGALLGAGGAVTANANQATQQQITEQAQAPKEQPKKIEREPSNQISPVDHTDLFFRGYGTPPKQYGQWLQMNGRQNWAGKKPRHSVQIYRAGNRECS